MSGIVVGFDGSQDAQRALEWAVAEGAVRKTSITVITVIPTAITIAPAGGAVAGLTDRETLQEAESVTRAAADKAAVGHDVSVSVRVVCGVPAEELLNASSGADMLVVGSRGHGGFTRLLLGSVSNQVAHHANCPIVIVPTQRRG